ncbi:hypothetical protein C2G38_2193248 [Gigaspora rosea]|uniref:MULE transposase domain-containing protein n=1 Tax=Gigaspora rosea TaxID=44941 RepID=A0A397V249_9GLOM|nr:hypothetical protein C2G38_2193248 [Gigaspora rosea]
MFSRLAEEVEEFNSNRKGSALMQPFIAPTNTDPGQPFVLVIVTNLMKHCHALQQAGELVYMDTTAGLDVLNTPMTILSTSTLIGGLPLVIMLTSNETTNTFTKALDMLKYVMPILACNGHGPVIGPKVFMTDDSAWKWLWDSKHGINKDNCVALIEYLKKISFARTETRLREMHIMFISSQPLCKLHQAQIDKESMDTTVEPTMLTSDALIKNTNCDFNDYDKENMHPGSSAMSPSQFLNNENTADTINESINKSINESANESSVNESSDNNDDSENDENLNQLTVNEFRWFYNDIENLIKEDDPAFNKSVRKFIKAYIKHCLIQDTHTRSAIASFFQTCDWKSDRVNGNSHQRCSKRVKVQVAAVAKRKGTSNKGQKKLQGKPRTGSQEITHDTKEALEENRPNGVI